jgi:hypothetical protein
MTERDRGRTLRLVRSPPGPAGSRSPTEEPGANRGRGANPPKGYLFAEAESAPEAPRLMRRKGGLGESCLMETLLSSLRLGASPRHHERRPRTERRLRRARGGHSFERHESAGRAIFSNGQVCCEGFVPELPHGPKAPSLSCPVLPERQPRSGRAERRCARVRGHRKPAQQGSGSRVRIFDGRILHPVEILSSASSGVLLRAIEPESLQGLAGKQSIDEWAPGPLPRTMRWPASAHSIVTAASAAPAVIAAPCHRWPSGVSTWTIQCPAGIPSTTALPPASGHCWTTVPPGARVQNGC